MLDATADTNIYVSALNFGGLPAHFIALAQKGRFRLSVSDALIQEVQNVLRREKFGWPEEALRRVKTEVLSFARYVTPVQTLDVIKADPPDNRILECAVAVNSNFIVSGDRHLLRLKQYGNIRIVKVAEFLALLSN